MKKWKTVVLAAVLGGARLGSAPAPMDLGLGEALREALAKNPALQRSLLEQVRREAESREARGALLPSLEAQASEIRHSFNYETYTGEPAHGTPVLIGPFSVRSVGLQAEVPLLDLSLWRRWRGSEAMVESGRAEVEQAREEISALVVGQYLLALRAEAQIRAIQARIDLARNLEDLAVHQEQSGVGTGLDTLRAKVRTRTEEQALIRARTSRQEAVSGLVRLLALPAGTELHLKPLPGPETPDGAGAGLEEDVRSAIDGRADFRSLQAQSRAADERVEGVRALRLPSLQAFGSLQDMGLVKTNLERVFEVGVQVRVPLFTGGRIQAQENQARAARSQLDAVRRDQEARVAFEVRVARERLEAARSEVSLSEGVLDLSREELEQARHRFEAGVSSNIELVSAQEELAKAQEGNLDARYRLDQAQADLAHAKGELEARYVR